MSHDKQVGVTRRAWMTAAGGLPIAAAGACATAPEPAPELPALADFSDLQVTHLDAGSVHPFSKGARAAVNAYLASRGNGATQGYSTGDVEERVNTQFAQLINATPAEICAVQSTSMGEWLALRALGLPDSGGRIVTDALHFFGSFHLYNELQRQGVDVVVVPMRDNAIAMADLEAAVNRNTKLVAISAVSTVNGFQHDVKAVADLAHAHGAHIYVDAVHACGAVPFDVKATGVDLAATSTYKWLMGDMGLGFIYARGDLIPQLRRPQYGYYQVASFASHAYPLDPPGERLFDTAPRDDAQGLFAMGTHSNTVLAHLDYSLAYLNRVGVDNIQAYRQPMIEKLRREVPALNRGFRPLTPENSTSALIGFVYPNARGVLAPLLRDANIRATVSTNRIRFSASVFNTMADIDRALEVLATAPVA
jgi:selenocysteine lyase/cysteine desulfurase